MWGQGFVFRLFVSSPYQKCRVKDERSDICEALTIFLSLSNGVIDPNTTLDARGMALNMWMKFLLPWSSYFRAGKQRINTRISKWTQLFQAVITTMEKTAGWCDEGGGKGKWLLMWGGQGSPLEEVTFDWDKDGERNNHAKMWGQRIPDREKSKADA